MTNTIADLVQPDAESHVSRGALNAENGRVHAAIEEFRTALRLDPRDVSARIQLADLLLDQCQPRQAGQILLEAQAQAASAIEQNTPAAGVASAFKDIVRLVDAVRHYRAALDLSPRQASIHSGLARALRMQGQVDAAIEHLGIAIDLDARSETARAGMADVLLTVGRVEESIEHLRNLVAMRPDLDNLHSSLLLALHYRELCTPRELFEEHRRFGERPGLSDGNSWYPEHRNRHLSRPLRIAYISSDFRAHSVAYFIEPLIENHERRDFHVTCYSKVAVADAVTARLKRKADHWRDVRGFRTNDLVNAIRADEIDILVDLAGHTLGNSLRALSRRAAPIQVSYLGYPNTTGVPAIDYRLTDSWADPGPEADALCTEELVRLGPGFLCYRPPEDAPPVRDLPAGIDAPITFGSFNNLNKLSPEVIACWAALLKLVPKSRLVLKAGGFGHAAAREHIHSQFLAHGVGLERLQLIAQDPSLRSHLERYNEIDIALDTFPYNGTTTTCEAAWMGVPVLTLAGRTHVSRVGVSLLSQLGLPELIAGSVVQYVELAVGLSRDRERLATMRREMRTRMSRSSLTDPVATTKSVEEAYRKMWRTWVGTQSPS
jgi:protein O-GlcNAc transferase